MYSVLGRPVLHAFKTSEAQAMLYSIYGRHMDKFCINSITWMYLMYCTCTLWNHSEHQLSATLGI